MSRKSLNPTNADLAEALCGALFEKSDKLLISRKNLAAILNLNPVSVCQYEGRNHLTRSGRGPRRAVMYRWATFRDALRYLLRTGQLETFARLHAKSVRGAKPRGR